MSLQRLFPPSALLCPHHTLGVTAVRLLFLLCALNMQWLCIAVFYTSQGPFGALTWSIFTNNPCTSGSAQDQWFTGGQSRLELEIVAPLNAPQLSEHSYLTRDLQLTSQTHLNSGAGPRKHVFSTLSPLSDSDSLGFKLQKICS